MPSVLIAGPHRIRLRYVLERELLADPCLDAAGRRLPNYFVRHGTGCRPVSAFGCMASGKDVATGSSAPLVGSSSL